MWQFLQSVSAQSSSVVLFNATPRSQKLDRLQVKLCKNLDAEKYLWVHWHVFYLHCTKYFTLFSYYYILNACPPKSWSVNDVKLIYPSLGISTDSQMFQWILRSAHCTRGILQAVWLQWQPGPFHTWELRSKYRPVPAVSPGLWWWSLWQLRCRLLWRRHHSEKLPM